MLRTHLAQIGIGPVSPRGEYCVGVRQVAPPDAYWNCVGVRQVAPPDAYWNCVGVRQVAKNCASVVYSTGIHPALIAPRADWYCASVRQVAKNYVGVI